MSSTTDRDRDQQSAQSQEGHESGDPANDASDSNVDLLPVGHGNSPAAWTCVGVMMVGVFIGCLGYVFDNLPVVLAGLGVVVLGLIAGGVMRAMGYGVGGSKIKKHGE